MGPYPGQVTMLIRTTSGVTPGVNLPDSQNQKISAPATIRSEIPAMAGIKNFLVRSGDSSLTGPPLLLKRNEPAVLAFMASSSIAFRGEPVIMPLYGQDYIANRIPL